MFVKGPAADGQQEGGGGRQNWLVRLGFVPVVREADDQAVRAAAFDFLSRLGRPQGERWPVVSRSVLSQGFTFQGHRVTLVGPQGIFKPALLDIPLSITTVPRVEGREAPYDDQFGYQDLLYRYRGTDRRHPDNVGLRRAMVEGTLLVYFHGIVPGRYLAVWPVRVMADNPETLSFTVSIEAPVGTASGAMVVAEDDADRRAYGVRLLRTRLHQESFRQRVLRAYRASCAICRLRHEELLDAAHILPDGHPRGLPVLPNGLSLCKLHHAAFDANIIGIRPDLAVEVRRDVRDEIDGPMLQHGLQGMHGAQVWIPARASERPSRDNLEERYEQFRAAV